jgi:aminoglycoside phosphotransferase (APT) family kinase protein
MTDQINEAAALAVLSPTPVESRRGFYNVNDVVLHPALGKVVVRRPIRTMADDIEPRQLLESEVILAVEHAGILAPRLLYVAGDAAIYSFVEGVSLEGIASPSAIPPGFVEAVVDCMVRLESVSRSEISTRLGTNPWTGVSDGSRMLEELLHWERRLFLGASAYLGSAFTQMGLRLEAFYDLAEQAGAVGKRRLQLCHGDIQPYNILLENAPRRFAFMDWELAALNDPLWDMALHIQRTPYDETGWRSFAEMRVRASSIMQPGDLVYLKSFIAVECLKSLVNDSMRYVEASALAIEVDGYVPDFADDLSRKLLFAKPFISGMAALTSADVRTLLLEAALKLLRVRRS